MANRIAAAAQAVGIGLTLLPVFYAHSGFGGRGTRAAPVALRHGHRRLRITARAAAGRRFHA